MDVAERSNCLNRTSAARFRGRLEANSSTASANRFVRCSRSFSIELSTSYFLLSTSYFLLPTSYFLLPTFYFLLSTFYFLLSTSYFLLSTSLQTSAQRGFKRGISDRYLKIIPARAKAMPIRGRNIRGCDTSRESHPR